VPRVQRTKTTCKVCLSPLDHLRPNARYCSIPCRKKAYRDRNLEQSRKAVREANRRRYYSDPDFREKGLERTRKWREKHHSKTVDEILENKKDRFRKARALGYRSGLEVSVARQLEEAGVDAKYEAVKIYYTPPQKTRTYTPDWVLPNGVVLESKGLFTSADRMKHLHIQAEHPDLDLRFIFTNSQKTISKTSKTTYADWCRKHGFQFADKEVPQEWLI